MMTLKKMTAVLLMTALVGAAVSMLCAKAQADEFESVVFSNVNGTSNLVKNTAFYNARILAITAKTLAPAHGVTNTFTIYTVSADGFTNTVASLETTNLNQRTVVDTNNYVVLKGGTVRVTTTTNGTVEVILDNRAR